jgi:hypothetical protein
MMFLETKPCTQPVRILSGVQNEMIIQWGAIQSAMRDGIKKDKTPNGQRRA